MAEEAIRVEHVAKAYRLGPQGPRYRTLRDTLAEATSQTLHTLLGRHNGRVRQATGRDTVWALHDVSFTVAQGEVVGIIGRNGAGKSTLLKLLAHITAPSRGRVGVRGRVGALLEVGTGFHPELTGRDNIFLAGAVLGMRRAEIARQFEQIVAFAEVERFIDTPVKHYSSGMYMRLAFAVAAHLEPEILLVDEVLAVGDAEFQKRCLGKMQDVGGEGRTVLFVSHNMPAILRLCPRVILLDGGRLVADGPAAAVTATYLRANQRLGAERCWPDLATAPGNHIARLRAVRVLDAAGACTASVDIQQPFAIELEYWNLKAGEPLIANIHLYDAQGTYLFASHDNLEPTWGCRPRPAGLYRSLCTIPGNFLNSGRITVHAAVGRWNPHAIHAWVHDAVAFDVIDTGGVRGEYPGPWAGAIRPYLEWGTRLAAPLDSVPATAAVSEVRR
ncbi:MAG TPA: ABC transporter ATP-binding protein [Chloroflexota bacterium]|jgi:lipopolysaccharide transport system ATP-binding protein|nr:ABC transporter ATP-binding protein [Chloroflexota bacterium]